ncbi:MAG: KH domain-containing protein [Anaerolineaceae bacterium]|nr:KH domain-containing protein [Anaerolineaceae bacterium]MCY3935565.1 KH domain-containing protein [Chloroflexota bacterium]MCY4009023.1 KH domain-containing protein [Anaerolineaceae bacterium]MCY4105758.1 KH domain-containing protein [Chloroflexota bacterium]
MERELVNYIAQQLVSDRESVEVRSRMTRDALILELKVAPEDMGRIIGRNGSVANAIRSVLRASTRLRDKRILLDID